MKNQGRAPKAMVLLLVGVWIALAVPLVPSVSEARVRRVPQDFTTIQAAANAAVANDTVLVGPGTYLESVDAGTKWLTFLSVAGRDATVIDAQGAGRVLTLQGGGIVIGFTLQGGRFSDLGGGVLLDAPSSETRTCVIQGNRVRNCRGRSGGGIYVDTSIMGVRILENEIQDNQADIDGGGIYCGAPGIVEKNVISGNFASDSGGGILTLLAAVRSNVIVENCASSYGGGILTAGANEVSSNTIVGNTCQNGGNAIYFDGPVRTALISHNVIVSNGFTCWWTSRTAVGCGPIVRSIRIECNAFWGNRNGDLLCEGGVCDTTGLGNFRMDPMFCDATSGDYRLQEGSPCAPTSGTGCGLVGALPVACGGTPVLPMTWGRLKSLYKDWGRK